MDEDIGARPRRSNHLAGERSLYLRMHAENPVDWYPWREEAFNKAKSEGRPIFLSIGYSACHWCHVMARESFESEDVASVLNHSFVSIKVDREERPDVDSIYMAACQLMSGTGGWPLSLVVTPELKPFFAATYIPRSRTPSGPGFIDIMAELGSNWKLGREPLEEYSQKVAEALKAFASRRTTAPINLDPAEAAFRQLRDSYDVENGGFEVAPKFPSPHRLLLLLQIYERSRDEKALSMVVGTLDAMRNGGIYDHVGSGFHRYSTDRKWHLPHFEKMLYDQAMQILAYSEAYRVTRAERFGRTALDVIGFVEREMTSPEGAFYSSVGADSEGQEGKFYVWSLDEINRLLERKDAEILVDAYGVTKDGNFRDESSARRTGLNVLHRIKSSGELSRAHNKPKEQVESSIADSLKRLQDARKMRVRPDLDDKVLADWNGLMIAALARASEALGTKRPRDLAIRASDRIERLMFRRGLSHRAVGDEVAVDGLLDDYASLVWGLAELGEATGSQSYLDKAEDMAGTMIARFRDPSSGAFYQTAVGAPYMIARMCEGYDGALPSGNSIACYALASLDKRETKGEYAKTANDIVEAFSGDIRENPAAHAFLILAYEVAKHGF